MTPPATTHPSSRQLGPRQILSWGLLAFLPLTAAAHGLHWGESWECLLAAVAILPLAIWLSTATEELALVLGPSIGALLNAVFGNATELIIALAALRAGLVDIVKASITGTLMANLLLALGLSMLVGGIGRQEQSFQPVLARVNGSAMTLAVLAILLPSLSALSPGGEAGREAFSTFVAWVLLVVYGLTLLFSLRTHRSLYDVASVALDPATTEDFPGASPPLTQGEVQRQGDGHWHGDELTPVSWWQRPGLLRWLVVLLLATVALAWASEQFVDTLEPVTASLGLPPVFTGVVLLPLLGGAAEYLTGITMARRNKMDLAVSVALGSTLLVALFVVPVLVLTGPILGHPLDLGFGLYELVAIATAVVVSNLVSLDGRSDWLEGVLLLAAYVILAAGFYYQSGASPVDAAGVLAIGGAG